MTPTQAPNPIPSMPASRRRKDRLFRTLCATAAVIACLTLITLLGKILLDGTGRLFTMPAAVMVLDESGQPVTLDGAAASPVVGIDPPRAERFNLTVEDDGSLKTPEGQTVVLGEIGTLSSSAGDPLPIVGTLVMDEIDDEALAEAGLELPEQTATVVLADDDGRLYISREEFVFRADFFKQMPFESRPESSGILPALLGTAWVIGLTALIAVPVGVAAAVYLQEFNTKRNRFIDFVQVNIANLAGVPSIVYGMLGLAIFVFWLNMGRSIIAGALTMSLLILPLVILVAQESLKAVPESFRHASLAMGATRWQTIRRVVLPNALPGILTGVILAISRAIGETAPLIVVGAVAQINFLPDSPTDRYAVLPYQIFTWSARPEEAFNQLAAGAILVLMLLLLLLNSTAIWIRSRAQRRY